MSEVGRPKKEKMDNIIKVSVNDETAEVFDKTAKITGKSKSDLLRELIPIVSSKDFERMIPNTSLELLERYSNDCWKLIHTEGSLFEVDQLSERMPAFITNLISPIENPMICVKYPTFKIQIFNGLDAHRSTDQKELQELLSKIPNKSDVYATKVDCLIIGNKLEQLKFPYVNEVMCLDIRLDECIKTKDMITAELKANGFNFSVYHSFCIRTDYVELVDNQKYFRIKGDLS